MFLDHKKQLVTEIQTMLRYMADIGISVPFETLELLNELDISCDRSSKKSVSKHDEKEIDDIEKIALRSLQNLHSSLSKACSPATPLSIKASNFKENYIVLIGLGLGCVGIAMIIIYHFYKTDIILGSLGAAIVGSVFYSLYTASQYIKSRTFDPSYNQYYIIRLVLGVFSGYLLANIIGPTLPKNAETDAIQYGPILLGVIGGFSAEAVVQILQRFADTLVTVVKGSDKEKVKTEVDRAVTKQNTDTTNKLNSALTNDDPNQLKESVKNLIKDLT
jgi:hypothetical protein